MAAWCNYTGNEGTPPHTVIPKEDKTFVVKTGDGLHYRKIRILSYYRGKKKPLKTADTTPSNTPFS